ncbi:MAG: serine hydrolase [Clostridia bacterium]|jgi:CubicO group peptidase (beta-lactamase class C family)
MDHLLDKLIESAKQQKLNILNIAVRKDGKIIARHDFVPEKPQMLWSVSKTFTSMAVGIAESEGYLKLDDRVTDFFDSRRYAIPDDFKRISIHDLLCMGSGQGVCPVTKALDSGFVINDICDLFFNEPLVYEPGTHFVYSNANPYMLSRIILATTGYDLLDYLNERIFEPLGISRPHWDKCPLGITLGFSGLMLCATDLSKFGQLILDKGVFNGSELIPSSYIEKASHPQISTEDFRPVFATNDSQAGYGYYMWMNSYPGSFRMDGLNGQYVVILPDKNAVVTYLSYQPENTLDILKLTWDTLVNKL